MKRLLVALQFLTRVPIPVPGEVETRDLGRSMLCFPLAGAILGLVLAGAYLLLGAVLPPLATSVVVVLLLSALTGGLHLDGLADTFDGFYAGRTRERVLEIMKDSHVGVMGAAAIAGDLLLKSALLAGIPREAAPWVLVAAPALSRWTLVLGAHGAGSARGSGLGRDFIAGLGRAELFGATIVAVILGGGALLWIDIRLCLTACLAAAVLAYLWAKFVERRIGGMTGDTLGALNEMAEVAVLFAACALLAGG